MPNIGEIELKLRSINASDCLYASELGGYEMRVPRATIQQGRELPKTITVKIWVDAEAEADIERTYPQHPMYETWKNICPFCNSSFTCHLSASAEDRVLLRCECGQQFRLKDAFMKQYELHAKASAGQ